MFRKSLRNSELSEGKVNFTTKTEKEYLKPTYAASIGEELEDGLFDGNCNNFYLYTKGSTFEFV